MIRIAVNPSPILWSNAMPRFRTLAGFSRGFLLGLVCIGPSAVPEMAAGQTFAQQSGPNGNLEHCRAIADDATRLRCYERATSKPATNQAPVTTGPGVGTWRLVRTRNPAGGQDAVSIMQTADITKSDLDLAGLMLRCGEGGTEILIVLVGPLPPRAHPKVTVSAAGRSVDFTATIVPPGAVVLLPKEASVLASGPWTAASELSVQIEATRNDGEPNTVRGVIPLSGLGGALAQLQGNCSPQ